MKLRAEVGSYVAGLKQAQNATGDFGKEVAGHSKKSSADIQRIGTVSVLAGAGIAAAFGKAVFTAADFEKQLSGVQAVSGASADEMHRLSDAALAAGASTKLAGVTASDAANAEAELVKAGVSVSDVLGGALMGSLTLAAAGQLDFADAATIAAQAMNIFDLSGRDVSHIADVLAAAANKSAADVGQLGDALRQGGLVAAQTGLTLEESVGALAAFGDNALIGSDAGTSLKTMLQRLTPQSKEAADLMEKLGFSAYDASGNFIGLEGLAGELQDSLKGMTNEQRNAAMGVLFGSDAVRAANVLYEEGAAGIADYVSAVDDEGAAARMAAIQNDNLKGDLEALGGALESALIENGSKATDALRTITQGATDLVGGFSSMPDTLQTVTAGLGGIVGAASLMTGGFITVAPKIKGASDALKEMDSGLAHFAGNNLGKLATGLGVAGAALAAGVYIYGKATEASREYATEVADLSQALDPVATGQANLNEEMENFLKLQQEGLSTDQIEAMNQFGVSLTDVQNAIRQGKDALDPFRAKVKELGVDLEGVDIGALDDGMEGLEGPSDTLAKALGISEEALISLIDQVEDWDNEAQDSAKRTIESAVANDTFSQSAVDAAYAVNTNKDGTINYAGALDLLSPKLDDTEEGVGDVGGAMSDAEQAADDLKEAIERLLTPMDTRAALDQFNTGLLDMTDHFKDADEAVGKARDDLADKKNNLADLLAMPADDRGDHWARQVEDARDAIADAEAKVQEAIDGTNRTLEGNSRAALENRDALDQLARDAVEVMKQAAADETLTIDQRMAMRDTLIAQMEGEAEAVGLNKDQVDFYTQALKNIPLGPFTPHVGISISEQDQSILNQISNLNKLSDVGVIISAGSGIARRATGGPIYAAVGGWPWKPSGTDTVPAMLSPGEYVVQKSAVDRFGLGLMDSINSGTFSPTMSAGSSSFDNSRHVTMPVEIRAFGSHPRTARDISYSLAVLETELSVR